MRDRIIESVNGRVNENAEDWYQTKVSEMAHFVHYNVYAFLYASKNSFLVIPDWVQIVLKVEAFIFGWFGIVRGVLLSQKTQCESELLISRQKALLHKYLLGRQQLL